MIVNRGLPVWGVLGDNGNQFMESPVTVWNQGGTRQRIKGTKDDRSSGDGYIFRLVLKKNGILFYTLTA